MKTNKLVMALMSVLSIVSAASCSKSKSYSELLTDEQNAVNWYLAQNRVEPRIPADSNFVVGKDAPFYRMNADGTVYMRVLDKGDMTTRPEKGQTVYIRFTRYDINKMYAGYKIEGAGNEGDLSSFPSGNSFIFGNNTLSSTTQYGSGIQVPLNYLGYNCEVDLIVKSVDGFSSEITNCTAYVYKSIKYFKAEY